MQDDNKLFAYLPVLPCKFAKLNDASFPETHSNSLSIFPYWVT